MLEQVLMYLKNWFVASVHTGEFSIVNGTDNLPPVKNGQYYRIVGSVFNDGLHRAPEALYDETFRGTVYVLAVPRAVIDLAEEIEAWNKKHYDRVTGPYQSESFGGYTYSLKSETKTGSDGGTTWEKIFANRLNVWRKI